MFEIPTYKPLNKGSDTDCPDCVVPIGGVGVKMTGTQLAQDLSITDQQTINWLNNNLDTANRINVYLQQNNNSEEAKVFANMAIKELVVNDISYNKDNDEDIALEFKKNDLEPVKRFSGTIADFKKLLDNSPRSVGKFKGQQAKEYLLSLGETEFNFKQMRPLPTQTGYFNNKVGRYIYTKKGGWIDMSHFMFYAGKAYKYKINGDPNPIGEAVQDGYFQERSDVLVAPHSAYSYEDLPSDKFGAEFAVNYFDHTSVMSTFN